MIRPFPASPPPAVPHEVDAAQHRRAQQIPPAVRLRRRWFEPAVRYDPSNIEARFDLGWCSRRWASGRMRCGSLRRYSGSSRITRRRVKLGPR